MADDPKTTDDAATEAKIVTWVKKALTEHEVAKADAAEKARLEKEAEDAKKPRRVTILESIFGG